MGNEGFDITNVLFKVQENLLVIQPYIFMNENIAKSRGSGETQRKFQGQNMMLPKNNDIFFVFSRLPKFFFVNHLI